MEEEEEFASIKSEMEVPHIKSEMVEVSISESGRKGEEGEKLEIIKSEFEQEQMNKSGVLDHCFDQNLKKKCIECDKIISKKHFKQHVKSVHLKIKDFFCEQCPSTFSDKKQLDQHSVTHKEEKSHKCDVCDKMFKTKSNLKLHSNIHTKKKLYFCDDCGKSFAHQSYFIRHKKEQHTEFNAFECKLCPQTFRTHLRLKTHKKSHNAQNSLHKELNKEENSKQQKEKPKEHTEEFKLNAMKRAEETGINRTAKELGIMRVKLRGWINKMNGIFMCESCGTNFEFESKLKAHIFNKHTKTRTNFKYTFDDNFRAEVVKFVKGNSIADAVTKYDVSDAAIRNWVKRLDEPLTCLICGTIYGYEKRMEDHLKKKHNIADPFEQQNSYKKEVACNLSQSVDNLEKESSK